MDDIYENTEEYNPNKKRKILAVFDDMIAEILSNKKRNPMVTVSKEENSTFLLSLHNLILVYQNILDYILFTILLSKFQTNKNFSFQQEQIPFNHSSDTDFKNFMNLYKKIPQNHVLF